MIVSDNLFRYHIGTDFFPISGYVQILCDGKGPCSLPEHKLDHAA